VIRDGEDTAQQQLIASEPVMAELPRELTPILEVPFATMKVVIVDDEAANCRVVERMLVRLGAVRSNVTILVDGECKLVSSFPPILCVPVTAAKPYGATSSADCQCFKSVMRFISIASYRSLILTPLIGTGTAGVEAAAFVEHGTPADIMLLDIRMPGKSGLEVMKDALTLPPYPVYAMTAQVDADAQEEFQEAGFSGCLGKPFTADSLKRIFQHSVCTEEAKREWYSTTQSSHGFGE
jgi:CheY-like chemotaxis protein